jgi:membrane associated rhomboid family serine protease
VFRLPPLTPFVRSVLIALAALFVTGAIVQNMLRLPFLSFFALDPNALSVWTPLQVFAHVWVLPPRSEFVVSLLVSMFFLWLILAPFEERFGTRRTGQLVVVSALSAALPALLLGQLFPAEIVAGPQTITQCALCAYAASLPANAVLNFWGLMLKPAHLLLVVIGISVVFFLTTQDVVKLGADLGSIGGGYAYVKWWVMRGPPPRSRKQGKLRVIRGNDEGSGPKRWLN